MIHSPQRLLRTLALLISALLGLSLPSEASALPAQDGPVKLLDFVPDTERLTESKSETQIFEGVVILPEGLPTGETFQVTAHVWSHSGLSRSHETTADEQGHFRFELPRNDHWINFRGQSTHFSAHGGSTYYPSQPREIRLTARAKRAYSIQCIGKDSQAVEAARFWRLDAPYALPGSSDSKGQLQVHLRSAFRGGFLMGVSSEGLIAGPIPVKDDGPDTLRAVFKKPARVRIPFAKKYSYATGNLSATIQNWPKSQWPKGFQTHPSFSLMPGTAIPATDSGDWVDGIQEFLVPPGHAWHFTFELDPKWSAKVSVPSLQAGQVFTTPTVTLDPGSVLRGRLVDEENAPVANALVRGLRGWLPEHIGFFPSLDLPGPGGDDRESNARKRAHRETRTDLEGRFYLDSHHRILTVPLEIHLPTDPGSTASDRDVRQYFPKVAASGEEQTLVFAPKPLQLTGVVLFPNGTPVQEFDLQIESQGHHVELLYDQFNTKEESKDWYQFIAPSWRGDLTFSSSDGGVLGPPYSPTTQFHFEGQDGRFDIGVLPKGSYRVTVITDRSHAQSWENVTIPSVDPLTLRLKASASLAVRVHSDGKLPVAGLKMQLKGPLTSHGGSLFVSSEGTKTLLSSKNKAIRFEPLAPGRYELSSPEQGEFGLVKKEIRIRQGTQHDYIWGAAQLGGVNCKIDWPSGPLSVGATLAWKGKVPAGEVDKPGGRWSVVADTAVEWRKLREGTYTLSFKLDCARDRIDYFLPPREVVVKAGSVTDVTIQPAAGLHILHGTVRVNGLPVSEGELLVQAPEGGRGARRFKVSKEGTFRIPVLDADSLRLHYANIVDPSQKRTETIGTQMVHVGPAAQSQLALNFENHDVEIWFVDEAGAPLEVTDAMVSAFDLVGTGAPKSLTYWRTAIGAGDHVLFPAVPPGEYIFSKNRSAKHFQWSPDPKQRIQVSQSAPTRKTVALQRRYRLQGSVLCADWPSETPTEVTAWADAAATVPIKTVNSGVQAYSRFTFPLLADQPIWLTVSERTFGRKDRSAAKTPPQGPFDPKNLVGSRIQLTIDWPGTPEPRPKVDPFRNYVPPAKR